MSRQSAALHAERIRAAQRARLIAWLEQFERMHRTPARTPAEREAKADCLEQMEAARPRNSCGIVQGKTGIQLE